MSIDLFVIREKPLSWPEVLHASNEVARKNDGLSFWAMTIDAEHTTAYFWQAPRVTLSMNDPDPDDVAVDDPPPLAKPMVVVSSRSGAWPWIEWTAMAVADHLGAQVYDPQNGELYRARSPQHNLAALRTLHEIWLNEAKPKLVSSYWAIGVGKPTALGLREHVEVIATVAREVLGVDRPILLSGDAQVNFWHTFEVDGAEITVSSAAGSIYDPNPQRTLHVEVPAANARGQAFANVLAARLGTRFRSIEEYRQSQ